MVLQYIMKHKTNQFGKDLPKHGSMNSTVAKNAQTHIQGIIRVN